ncbi:hypothetical protein KUCAC02_002604 [Chaenocephalus aceratus]|uniref:Uncharacterized protein n=1 Tax=Chaenocephalus aceratus TaxID=36190 RepID=A0ACB9XVK3_CHAAC|nr:hypothetical protein KUCAC02_002604 [Chaenocephalus aceratus]
MPRSLKEDQIGKYDEYDSSRDRSKKSDRSEEEGDVIEKADLEGTEDDETRPSPATPKLKQTISDEEIHEEPDDRIPQLRYDVGSYDVSVPDVPGTFDSMHEEEHISSATSITEYDKLSSFATSVAEDQSIASVTAPPNEEAGRNSLLLDTMNSIPSRAEAAHGKDYLHSAGTISPTSSLEDDKLDLESHSRQESEERCLSPDDSYHEAGFTHTLVTRRQCQHLKSLKILKNHLKTMRRTMTFFAKNNLQPAVKAKIMEAKEGCFLDDDFAAEAKSAKTETEVKTSDKTQVAFSTEVKGKATFEYNTGSRFPSVADRPEASSTSLSSEKDASFKSQTDGTKPQTYSSRTAFETDKPAATGYGEKGAGLEIDMRKLTARDEEDYDDDEVADEYDEEDEEDEEDEDECAVDSDMEKGDKERSEKEAEHEAQIDSSSSGKPMDLGATGFSGSSSGFEYSYGRVEKDSSLSSHTDKENTRPSEQEITDSNFQYTSGLGNSSSSAYSYSSSTQAPFPPSRQFGEELETPAELFLKLSKDKEAASAALFGVNFLTTPRHRRQALLEETDSSEERREEDEDAYMREMTRKSPSSGPAGGLSFTDKPVFFQLQVKRQLVQSLRFLGSYMPSPFQVSKPDTTNGPTESAAEEARMTTMRDSDEDLAGDVPMGATSSYTSRSSPGYSSSEYRQAKHDLSPSFINPCMRHVSSDDDDEEHGRRSDQSQEADENDLSVKSRAQKQPSHSRESSSLHQAGGMSAGLGLATEDTPPTSVSESSASQSDSDGPPGTEEYPTVAGEGTWTLMKMQTICLLINYRPREGAAIIPLGGLTLLLLPSWDPCPHPPRPDVCMVDPDTLDYGLVKKEPKVKSLKKTSGKTKSASPARRKKSPMPVKQTASPRTASLKKKESDKSSRMSRLSDGQGSKEDDLSRSSYNPGKSLTNGVKSSSGSQKSGSAAASGLPIYVDLAYIPNHCSAKNVDQEFFNAFALRTMWSAGTIQQVVNQAGESSMHCLMAKLSGVQTLQVTLIPTHDTEVTRDWYQQTHERQQELNIMVLASSSTVVMQDESFPACKIEF